MNKLISTFLLSTALIANKADAQTAPKPGELKALGISSSNTYAVVTPGNDTLALIPVQDTLQSNGHMLAGVNKERKMAISLYNSVGQEMYNLNGSVDKDTPQIWGSPAMYYNIERYDEKKHGKVDHWSVKPKLKK